MNVVQSNLNVETLKTAFAGSVITPTDADYDPLRRGYNLSINHHPALVLVPHNAQDVVAGVRFARDNGLGIAIQSTGHGQQTSVGEDAVLFITKQMRGVEIDPAARMARAEAGVLWEQVINAGGKYGLAPLNGSSPHVGVVGYTLGGGIGWLARKYGLAADSVRSIDIVTADGELRHASPNESSDLFWALLGSNGNFGVVTAIEFSLYPVEKIYGGSLVYPVELARDALRFYRNWVASVPDELTSSIIIIKFPNAPIVPENLRGKIQVIVRAVYAGDARNGEKWLQPWLDWQAPLQNSFAELPYTKIGVVSSDPTDPAAVSGTNELLDDLSDEAIDVIVRYATNPESPLVINEIRHAGGAIRRVAKNANAIGSHDVEFYLQMGGRTPTPEVYDFMQTYFRRYRDDLKPYLNGGVYLNFHSNPDAPSRGKDAFVPEAYERLVALKAKYDPSNAFPYSFQIVPQEQ
jgi:FAD/FMN-containing dehydrogenase